MERRRPSKCRTAAVILGCHLLLPALVPWSAVAGGRPAAWHEPGQREIPKYGVEVELVTVFATVLDAKSRPVMGMREQDFVIYEDGSPQTISQFSSQYVPLSVVILLDTSSSMAGSKLENARKSLTEFLKRLHPGDEVLLMTFRTRPTVLQPFTANLDRIRRELRRQEARGSTALYDSILAALDLTRSSKNRRRALLLLSDGINTYGRAQLKETIEILRREGAELFAIGLETSVPEDYQYRGTTRAVLGELTRSAGGEAFIVEDAADLRAVCRTISDRMHKQYSFGYYPAKGDDERWRSVRIEPRIRGLRVVPSKTGYYPTGSRN